MPWRSAGLVCAPGAPRNQCSASTLLPMKTATLWKMKTTRAGGCVNIGVRFLRRALKASGTIAMRLFCDTFRRLLTTYVWKCTEMNLMNSWPHKKESAPGPDGIPFSLHRCGFSILIQREQTCDWEWPSSSAICCEQNCFLFPSPPMPTTTALL